MVVVGRSAVKRLEEIVAWGMKVPEVGIGAWRIILQVGTRAVVSLDFDVLPSLLLWYLLAADPDLQEAALDTDLNSSESLLLGGLLQLFGGNAVGDQFVNPIVVTPELVSVKGTLVFDLSRVLKLELSCQVGFGGDMCQEVRLVGECGLVWTQEADQRDRRSLVLALLQRLCGHLHGVHGKLQISCQSTFAPSCYSRGGSIA